MKRIAPAALALLMLLLCAATAQAAYVVPPWPGGAPAAAAAAPLVREGPFAVYKVADGDTLRIVKNGERRYVRLLGIDAPELHNNRHGHASVWGRPAQKHLAQLIAGAPVYLITNDATDGYGRILAYVEVAVPPDPFTPPIFTDCDLAMVSDGYARAYDHFPCARLADYDRAQAAAKAAGKGMWGAPPPGPMEDK